MHKRLLREMVLGLWKIHVLHHAAEEGVVGHHMLQELREHGYDVSPGTLYPILHRLEKGGLLRCERSTAGSHAALRYEITPDGSASLALLREYVAELHRELSQHHEESRRTERGDRRKE